MPAMWDRLRTTQRDGGSSLDRKKLENWQNTRSSRPSGYSYNINGGRTPARPPREFEHPSDQFQTQAPAVQPPRYPPQAGRDSSRNSEYGRPASSVYSQPSPAAATFAARQLRNNPNEISPPSSPDVLTPRHVPHSHDAGDVSPIGETDNSHFVMDQPAAHWPDQGRSNIPTMRRERRKNSDAAQTALRESKSRERLRQPRPHGNDVRWDRHTGEPTTSDKGRPSQINPHQAVQTLSKARAPNGPAPHAGSSPNGSPFGERVRLKQPPRQANGSLQTEPAPRPDWRGASGRTTLVAPVNDTRNVAPLINVPRRSNQRGTRGAGALSPVDSLDSETTSPQPEQGAPLGMNESSKVQSPTARDSLPSQKLPTQAPSRGRAQPSFPSPPPSDGHSVPAQASQPRPQQQAPPPAHPSSPQTPFPPNDKAIRRKPAAAAGQNPHVSTSSSVYSQHDIHPAHAPPGAFPDDWTQPPSRFSVTTSATSAHTRSPRPSVDDDAPPLPTPPRQSSESQKSAPGSSILDRKRPIISGYEHIPKHRVPSESIKLNMDSPYYMPSNLSTTSQRPSGTRPVPRGNHSTLSVVSVVSMDKALPQAPPEESARDRVTQLNARLQSLGNRRLNINQAIKQMTELMPTDNILASDAVIRRREAEKRKVEVLKVELADVQREEYELGLKLHRAYKRMDRDAEFEPTTLWVRRVTGRE
ncbi:hypothetical protein BJ170DRAFT_442732 [Xylariales sp. AK1849]|nr:hypothetical protein BJ170DRAFT_442732 [Xylariales sp. AK1849]